MGMPWARLPDDVASVHSVAFTFQTVRSSRYHCPAAALVWTIARRTPVIPVAVQAGTSICAHDVVIVAGAEAVSRTVPEEVRSSALSWGAVPTPSQRA